MAPGTVDFLSHAWLMFTNDIRLLRWCHSAGRGVLECDCSIAFFVGLFIPTDVTKREKVDGEQKVVKERVLQTPQLTGRG